MGHELASSPKGTAGSIGELRTGRGPRHNPLLGKHPDQVVRHHPGDDSCPLFVEVGAVEIDVGLAGKLGREVDELHFPPGTDGLHSFVVDVHETLHLFFFYSNYSPHKSP